VVQVEKIFLKGL